MEESLKTARLSHQLLLGVCGVYLLGMMAFYSEGQLVRNVAYFGIEFTNLAVFNLIMSVVFLLAALRLCAYLRHVRIIVENGEKIGCIHSFPWILLMEKGWLTGAVNLIECLLLMTAGGGMAQTLREIFPVSGVVYTVALIGLFFYGVIQVSHIKNEMRRRF